MHQDTTKPCLTKSETVAKLPLACSDELAAVEFLEEQRWGDCPACVHCGSVSVYKMMNANGTARNARFLWRCHDCKRQFTVRVGTVYEESRLPLRHWCYAFWAACSSKKGVSALQIKRQCQISYKAALFMMHRVRWAMAPANAQGGKLTGTVECDETYVGGKPRKFTGYHKSGRGTKKTPVVAMVQRGGKVKAHVVEKIDGRTLRSVLRNGCDRANTRLITDEYRLYKRPGRKFAGGHETVSHSYGEYARGDVHTNTIEGFFSLLKRGLYGTFHAVSREHLHRYVSEFEFRYNTRELNDGQRTIAAIRAAEGKRLMYKAPPAPPADGDQLLPV